MKILVVAATSQELDPVKNLVEGLGTRLELDYLVTGVGMVATAYALTNKLNGNDFDLVLNIGLAGAVDHSLEIGSVVAVASDFFYELGAEDGAEFVPADRLGLTGSGDIRPVTTFPSHAFASVDAITVSTVHGSDASIALIAGRTDAKIESMEGAAFYYVCNQEGVPCLQLRAISNRVERRDRSAWNIPLALDMLAKNVYEFLLRLHS